MFALRSSLRQIVRFPVRPVTASVFNAARFNSSLAAANKLNTASIVSTYSESPILKFTAEHEWIAYHPDGTTYVGITKYAADALGDATYIELPEDYLNESVEKGSTIGSVESVKSASEIYSPVDGVVVEVNEELHANPNVINEDPMGDGWIAKLKVDALAEEDLLSEEEYIKLLEENE